MAAAAHDLPELVHAFRADDWQACWNMHLQGTLCSPDLPNGKEFDGPSVRDIPLDGLRTGAFHGLPIAVSRRMQSLWGAAIIRAGGWIGEGAPPYPTRWASKEKAAALVAEADQELLLEEARRKHAPDAPSRLGCLWLAEDTPAGRTMVSRIKGHDAFVMKVEIVAAERLMRVDAHWLGGDLDETGAAAYWSGRVREEQPLWEYLLDGQIRCTDPDEFARLRGWGREAGKRASGTQGPIGTPTA